MLSAQQVVEFGRAFLGNERGKIVVLQVYMDETGIHDDAPFVAVAAYVGRPQEWRAWTRDWNAAKRPIKVFHSTDCSSLRGEFKEWDILRRDQFVANLLPVIRNHEFVGVVIGINLNNLNEATEGKEELIIMFGTPYGACFQWVITTILDIADGYGSTERIAFIHETNGFKNEAFESFEFAKQ